MNQGNVLDFDELGMFFGEDYKINEYITVHSPTIGEIVEFGERNYYQMLSALISIPSDRKSQLDDIGIDYEDIDDFTFFYMLTRGLTFEKTHLLLGDVDLSKMELCKNVENEQLVMFNKNTGEILDDLAYKKLVGYLRKYHNITPKVEKAANKTTKKILIELDREKIKKEFEKEYKSILKPLISAMMRYPGFKYKSRELKECSLYEFMDTVQGAQIYVNSTSLLQGSYSGWVDTSKINKKEMNWLRDPSD